jgi:hypothetical protein
MGKDEETEELIKILLRVSKLPFDRLTALSGVEGLKRNGNSRRTTWRLSTG